MLVIVDKRCQELERKGTPMLPDYERRAVNRKYIIETKRPFALVILPKRTRYSNSPGMARDSSARRSSFRRGRANIWLLQPCRPVWANRSTRCDNIRGPDRSLTGRSVDLLERLWLKETGHQRGHFWGANIDTVLVFY